MVASGNTIYVNDYYQIYRSTNSGESWTYNRLNNHSCAPLINGNNIYVGTYNGIYRSTNNGVTWTTLTQGHSNYVYALAFDGTRYYSLVSSNRLYRSTSGDTSWVETAFPASSASRLYGCDEFISLNRDI